MADLVNIPGAVAVAAAVIAATTDLRHFKIPNWLTLPLLFLGVAYHTLQGGTDGLATSSGAALVGFLLLFPLYASGGMGAGDVKLVAGLGAWLKTTAIVEVLLTSCLLTGVYALVLLYLARRSGQTLASTNRVEALVASTDRRSRVIPFGAMIAAGLLLSQFCRFWL